MEELTQSCKTYLGVHCFLWNLQKYELFKIVLQLLSSAWTHSTLYWKLNHVFPSLLQPDSFLSDRASPPNKNRDSSPPPSPLNQPASSLQRQDSGPQGIKGILKKSRSTSVESDHSEGMSAGPMPSQQTSVTLSHPESEEEEEQHEDEEDGDEDNEVEEEKDIEEEGDRKSHKEEDSPTDGMPDVGSFSMRREEKNSCSSSSTTSSRESYEEMRSPSPDESLETTSTVSEDVDELESSLDQSQGSALKQRSGYTQT